MMKKAIYTLFLASLVVSCTENLEDKAVREAKEYTEKYCPTPYVNDSRTRRRLMPTRISSINFRKRLWTTTLV